jgi:hypothetical protein
MKKTLKLALAASALTAPAMAANLENPLYLPSQGELYSKTSAGVMYKKADNSDAHIAKSHDGATEFPIWRLHEEIGYGITEHLTVNGSFGYTHDGDIDRKGMHLGRLGLTYRVFDGTATSDIVWDLYADAHLGGISKMTGAYTPLGFNYDNYSNGRWGFYAGTKLGKTWGSFTGALFAEVLQTFGNHNNAIDVTPMKAYGAAGAAQAGTMISGMGGLPNVQSACSGGNSAACALIQAYYQATGLAGLTDDISINLKSTLEWNIGLKTFYEIDDRWSLGGGFTYKHHADNGIKSIETPQNNPLSTTVANALATSMSDMNDGFDEYILSVSVANQLTDCVQVALYGEYTFDTSHANSQNGTDVKAEVGARLNVAF